MSTVEATVSIMNCMTEQDQNKILSFTRELFAAQKDNPFKPMSENEFIASIDESLKQADNGLVQDADEAIDEISLELGI
ncbi:MAG: hypothetical protein K6A90_05395 [Lachnospiraceae bacterium]|nr:hypothetical protein [Lachnospiraceae bacterium]